MTTTSDPEGVLELRQYTLVPGRRDDLIAVFDSFFLESQDAVGGRVLGQFRDLDDPDRFVWLRAFADMASRQRALEAFYGGPVWAGTATPPTRRWSTPTTCFCSGRPPRGPASAPPAARMPRHRAGGQHVPRASRPRGGAGPGRRRPA